MSNELPTLKDKIQEYMEKILVVDTSTAYIYIGTLVEAGQDYLLLKGVDVHDTSQGTSSKEKYIFESKKFTTKTNRSEVLIRLDKVVSFSELDDVLEF